MRTAANPEAAQIDNRASPAGRHARPVAVNSLVMRREQSGRAVRSPGSQPFRREPRAGKPAKQISTPGPASVPGGTRPLTVINRSRSPSRDQPRLHFTRAFPAVGSEATGSPVPCQRLRRARATYTPDSVMVTRRQLGVLARDRGRSFGFAEQMGIPNRRSCHVGQDPGWEADCEDRHQRVRSPMRRRTCVNDC